MALFDRVRAFLTPLTAPEIVVESGAATPEREPQAVPFDARDVDPNSLRGEGYGGRFGGRLLSASALVNYATGQGTKRDASSFNLWGTPRRLGQIERSGMGRNALIQQALGKIPNAATREKWRTIILDDAVEDKQAVSDTVAAYEQRLGISQVVNRALFRGKQHSQALVIMGIDDGRNFDEPVNVDAIRTIRWAVVIDARDFQPYRLAPSTSEHFGNVELFQITNINGILEDGLRFGVNSVSFDYGAWESTLKSQAEGAGGQLLVHADRVMYFPTPDYYSTLDSLQDSFGAFFESMGGLRTAARESSMLKYKVKDNQRQQWNANAELAREHMSMMNLAKSALNAFVFGDGEDVSALNRNLSGLADLPNPIMNWVSASLSIPNTIMWQGSPGGFGKGEAERETFHTDVHAFQDQTLTPPLTRLHGYILVAEDGARLPATTKREIKYNDLSPPDEEALSKLRNDALERLEREAEAGLITRKEFRTAAEGLNDKFYRLELDEEFVEKPQPAQVGIFTGSIALLQALYPEGIPLSAARELFVALDPVHFDADNVTRIVPAPEVPESVAASEPTPTATGGSFLAPPEEGGEVVPGDEEDVDAGPSEIDIAWEQVERPEGAIEADELAELPEFNGRLKGRHVKQLAREGKIRAYPPRGFKKEPTFTLQEVKRALLERHGQLPAELQPAADALKQARDYGAQSVCVLLKLPTKLARYVPYNETHPGAPHVTLNYCKDVPREELPRLVETLREVAATFDPFDVKVDGAPVHYFDTPKGRCAYARASFDEQALIFDELAFVFEMYGLEVSRFDGGYKPHVSLAYLEEGETDYSGPAPDGSWEAASACVTYGGERVAVLDFEGLELPDDDSFEVDEPDPEGATLAVTDRAPLIQEGWIWRTQKDTKVRPEHKKLEGRRFHPSQSHPSQGEPGSLPNCRCAKEIIVPTKGTKRARASATRTTKRALKRRYDKVTGAALKRQAAKV